MSLPRQWNYELPDVFQVEASSLCNLKCEFCFRFTVPLARKVNMLSMETVDRLIATKALRNTGYIEFHHAGEPLLNPRLTEINRKLKDNFKIRTGFSTNGLLISKHMDLFKDVDFLTISVDSTTNRERYREQSFEDLLKSLDTLFSLPKVPHVDLQVVDFSENTIEIERLWGIVRERGWKNANVKTVPDCSRAHFEPNFDLNSIPNHFCINPWFSVSIHCDGDVLPCCFSFGKELVLGNIHEKTLEEIWQDKPVQALRAVFMSGDRQALPVQCSKCYMRSAALFQYSFLKEWAG